MSRRFVHANPGKPPARLRLTTPLSGGQERNPPLACGSRPPCQGVKNETPRSPAAHDPLVRGSKTKTPRSPAAHDPLVRGSKTKTPRSPAAHDPLVRGSSTEEIGVRARFLHPFVDRPRGGPPDALLAVDVLQGAPQVAQAVGLADDVGM